MNSNSDITKMLHWHDKVTEINLNIIKITEKIESTNIYENSINIIKCKYIWKLLKILH